MRQILIALALVIPAFAGVWPKDAWPTSTPEEQGIDSRKLIAALDGIRESGEPVHSLTIVRNGVLVLDTAFYPYEQNDFHNVASCTKSFVSALMGIAISKGFIRSVREPMLSLFPRYTAAGADPRKNAILVEHLLTMTSGLNCGIVAGDLEWMQMMQSPNWVQFGLNLPMAMTPGTAHVYCNIGPHLLTGMLQEATGISPLEFARQHLLEPLGIRDVIWPRDPQGVNHGASDLCLRPLDMARLGYMYLRRGEWDGMRVLPEEWVAESTRNQVSLAKEPNEPERGYGYLWWTWPGVYRASGHGGQSIAVWPEKDLVVVITGGGIDSKDMLLSRIFPAVADAPLPEDREAVDLLQSRIEAARRAPEPSPLAPLPEIAARVSGRTYRLLPNGLDARWLRLTFNEGEARLEMVAAGEEMDFQIGLDGVYRFSRGELGLRAGSKGSWISDNVFVGELNEIGNVSFWRAVMTFEGDRVLFDMTEKVSGQRVQTEGRADVQ